MLPFGKKYRDQKEQERLKELEEKARREKERHACNVARETVYNRGDSLGFPSKMIDVRFYNHLYGILLDYRTRIEELEKKLSEQEDKK